MAYARATFTDATFTDAKFTDASFTDASFTDASFTDALKPDIVRIGTTAHVLGLYQFRYIGQAGLYEGVMAQEVLEVMPEAVAIDSHGLMSVYYDKLGVPFRRLN